ncbi:MAG: acyltransferase [Candidatus Accumulibacter sp.]|jgi:predicted LPLAT superfamily acyltransferase|nr:acyltransferase [Accumulibacter sp.]
MHWAAMREAGFSGGIRFLFWMYRHGGIGLFRLLLFLVMPWYFLTNVLARRASIEYLARLYETSGGATPAPGWRNSFRHFTRFGENILDTLVAADAQGVLRQSWHVDGLEHLERLLDAGRGGVIITAHFGNPEICRRLSRKVHAASRLTILVHTRHAGRFNRVLASLDEARDVDLIQVGDINAMTAMRLSERIAAGGFVIIAGDRVPLAPGGATLAVDFLGREARFPCGPYILAAALACPTLMLFSASEKDGFFVTVRPLVERVVLPRRERAAAIRPYLETYVAALTRECLEHPLQWFNFFPFWQTPRHHPEPVKHEKSTESLA